MMIMDQNDKFTLDILMLPTPANSPSTRAEDYVKMIQNFIRLFVVANVTQPSQQHYPGKYNMGYSISCNTHAQSDTDNFFEMKSMYGNYS